jgi:amino-acid N-acetyltransferase
MTVRKATEADFPVIKTIIALFPEQLMQDHLPRPDEFFVAEEDGAIVGCCALEVYSERLSEIRSLAVLPKHQGKGIATKLIESCIAEAKTKGIYELLTITGTNSIFEKHGFASFKREKYALIKILA